MNRHQVKGSARSAAGKMQEGAGRLLGSRKQEAKGLAKQAAGKTQRAYGDAKAAASRTRKARAPH